jgi:uncharacterized membrane protein YhhN
MTFETVRTLMTLWPILALLFAGLEIVALRRNLPQLETLAKPAVTVCLFLWLYTTTGLQGDLLWFGLAILLSLAGDMLLMIPGDRMFVPGLVMFLLAHIGYLAGFQEQLLNPTGWSFILLFFVFLNGIRLLRRIVGAMRGGGQDRLVTPVIMYGLVISLMLYAAMSTMFNPAWGTGAAFLVSAGAFLFWISDLILAWNKFVSPFTNSRLYNMLAYHLGQIGLIAGVISQFG